MPSTPPDEQSLLGRLTNIFGGSAPELPKPDQDEEEGMVRMSFFDHLDELRHRLLMIVYGMAAAFCFALIFRNQMWDIVEGPAAAALKQLHVNPPELAAIGPMDVFQITWMKLPLLAALFLASPWVLYQVWAFIAPGLYKHERRWAIPFVASSAGLFIIGGVFAYFVIFRFGLVFLLGLGIGHGIRPTVSVTEYYDLFVDVMLAVGMVFEIPVLLFLLTLIRIVSPRFLLKHSRYAIMTIVVLAAVITPTGDVFNLTLFATPMIVLFYVGVFASYLLVLKRENKRFPWSKFLVGVLVVLAIIAIISWVAAQYFGYRFVMHAPFLVR
ncbi:MAG TPA: twin-arginine translocase subunit TatC [Bryobacteraceae bacterium]|nr:twin-arginine translocase subunit TatC [Bryobacteraceae bacterium]